MKLLVLFISLFATINQKLFKKEVNMASTYEEVEAIIENYGPYDIKSYNDLIEIYFNSELIESFSNPTTIKYFITEDNFYIFIKNSFINNLELYVYDLKGKLIKHNIIDNELIGVVDVIKEQDTFLIAGTIKNYNLEEFKLSQATKPYLKNNDCVIFRYNPKTNKIFDVKVFGGLLNESFLTLTKVNLDYYLTGIKDQNSGYDFGNGGNGKEGYLFIKLNKDLTEYKYLVFNDEIKNIEFKDKIFIFTKFNLYSFDSQLNQELGLKFAAECIFGLTSFNYKAGIFHKDSLKIYNINQNLELDSYSYPFTEIINEIKVIGDYLYLKGNKNIYKSIFYNNKYQDFTFIYDNFSFNNVDKEILAFPKTLKLKDIGFENGYDSSVFGTYDISLDYGKAKINCKNKILERCNVTNGYIYPTGYKLYFSGTGYLNGEEILNNYIISTCGNYELKLVGKDETVTKYFRIEEMDLNYQEDQFKTWDYEVYVNQDLYIDLDLEIDKDIKIEKVESNLGYIPFKFDELANKLTLTINKNIKGLYKYYIKNIVYSKNGKTYTKELNKELIVKVIDEGIELQRSVTNDNSGVIINIDIMNNSSLLRFIKVKTNEKEEQVYYIPIKNGKIDIDGIKSNDSFTDCSFYLVYDNGRKYYEEEILFDCSYNFDKGFKGEMVLNRENGEINQISIKINLNKNINNLKVDGKDVPVIFDKANYLPLIVAISLVIFVFSLVKIIKVAKRKKS